MPQLARVAGTPHPDTNPVFWRCWEQLGHAVVLQAVRDYASAQRMLLRQKNKDQKHFNPLAEIGYYETFFRSKYFGYICPKYDGHELLDILKNGGWKHIPRTHRYAKQATYSVESYYKPKENRDTRGRPRKYD